MNIIRISVNLTDEGIEVQLKHFPVWWFLQNDMYMVMTPRKARLPHLQLMASQSLNTDIEVLENTEDPSISMIGRGNARIGINILLSIFYPQITKPLQEGQEASL